MNNNARMMRSSFRSYITLFIIFSPATIITPLIMGEEKYIAGDFWIGHVSVVIVFFIWCLFLFQKIVVTDDGVCCVRYFFYRSTQFMKFEDMIAWSSKNPIEISDCRGNVMVIRWRMFDQVDQTFLFEKISHRLG